MIPGLKDGGNRRENFSKSVDPSLLEVLKAIWKLLNSESSFSELESEFAVENLSGFEPCDTCC